MLLLQGPTSTFFKRLQLEIERQGGTAKRVLFNAADELYALNRDCFRFSGSALEWEVWLQDYLTKNRTDVIVFFGCKRPAHIVAARLAKSLGIKTVSLEEGYMRTGYITCEEGGNNDLSPIMGQLPGDDEIYSQQKGLRLHTTFAWMNWWSMTYYLWRSWFSRETDKKLYHITVKGPLKDTLFWMANALRTIFRKFPENFVISSLVRRVDKDFIIVPLQLPSDSQMREAANGWTVDRLIDAALTSYANNRSVKKLVFKLHPLDGDALARERRIKRKAKQLGLADDVIVLHTGSISKLSQHADGMIIVNSTSGISAIHHGIPLLVLGKAVFRNEKLVMCGSSENDIDRFFDKRWAAEGEFRSSYLLFLKSHSLIPGDFYVPHAMRVGARHLTRRLLQVSGNALRAKATGTAETADTPAMVEPAAKLA